MKLINFFKKWANNFSSFAKKHKIITGILLIIIAVGVFLLRPKSPPPIETQTIKNGEFLKSLAITGSIASENSVDLSFQSGGTLIYVPVKTGDEVKRWATIAALDPSKLQASVRQAQQDFIAGKAVSEKYYDNHNDTESFDEKIARTAIDATQNKAYDALLKAEYDLNHSVLYSPIDGIVTRADATQAGINVTSTTVYTITDLNSLIFEVEIDEADIGMIKAGQSIKVVLDSYLTDTLNLTIYKVDFVSHKTSTGGDAFTVSAKINKDNSSYKYRVGMNGNAEIILVQKNNVISIPLSSIFEDNKVYVKKSNKFEVRTLKLGDQNDTSVEVLTGLSDGEEIVVDPTVVLQKDKISKNAK